MSADAARRDELRELYRELILDHAKRPRHFGTLPNATHRARGINPLCGDRLDLQFRVDGSRIADAAFEGSGCAISLASASLLTDTVIGLEPSAAMRYFDALLGRLTGREAGGELPELGKLEALEGVREFPSRVKCATLAWHALDSALKNGQQTVTTE